MYEVAAPSRQPPRTGVYGIGQALRRLPSASAACPTRFDAVKEGSKGPAA